MPSNLDTRTIKQARSELRAWGRFWQRYGTEITSGGSIFANMMQRCQRSNSKYHSRRRVGKSDVRSNMAHGVTRPVTANCTPTHSSTAFHEKEVFVPWSLQGIDDFIESLQDECKNALKRKYIEQEDNFRSVWLDRAEKLVMFRR